MKKWKFQVFRLKEVSSNRRSLLQGIRPNKPAEFDTIETSEGGARVYHLRECEIFGNDRYVPESDVNELGMLTQDEIDSLLANGDKL